MSQNLANAQIFASSDRQKQKKYPPIQIGKTYGEWTVLELIPHSSHTSNDRYRCRCSCGNIRDVQKHSLQRAQSKMCQVCFLKKRRKERHDKRLKGLKELG